MTVHNPPERAVDSQQAVDLVVALQRCITSFHADQAVPPILDGEAVDRRVALDRYIHARRARAMLFGQSLFSDPAWDILLMLFQADLDDQALTLEQLSEILFLLLCLFGRGLGSQPAMKRLNSIATR